MLVTVALWDFPVIVELKGMGIYEPNIIAGGVRLATFNLHIPRSLCIIFAGFYITPNGIYAKIVMHIT